MGKMPWVKTVRHRIYWEYAKLVAGSAVGNRRDWKFVRKMFNRLLSGSMQPSEIIRENKLQMDFANVCVYCGCKEDLHWDHIVPKSRGGPDSIDNQVQACKKCNLGKGDKEPMEWYRAMNRRYEVPRLVLGKYLKLAFQAHEEAGSLDLGDLFDDGEVSWKQIAAVFPRREERERRKALVVEDEQTV